MRAFIALTMAATLAAFVTPALAQTLGVAGIGPMSNAYRSNQSLFFRTYVGKPFSGSVPRG
jgi:hypothetical protein